MDAQFEAAPALSSVPHCRSAGADSAGDAVSAGSPYPPDDLTIEANGLLDDVRRALESDFTAATSAAARLVALLASKSLDDTHSVAARGGLAPWQRRKIQRYVEDSLEGGLSVGVLAKLVSLSSSYFCRAFKESFEEPPHAYVIKRRIERAKTLMLTTPESLSQIAFACGLADQAHFCRCFRQVMGLTPGAWRRMYADDVRVAA